MGILILFAVIGVILTGNILHELSHKQDYEGFAYDDTVCALIMDNNLTIDSTFTWNGMKSIFGDDEGRIAFYSYRYNSTSEKEVKEINAWTEKKAYFINFIIFIFFLICFIAVLNKWAKKN